MGRTLLTLDEAKRRRAALTALIAGGEPTPLDRLEVMLGGSLPRDVEDARTLVKRAALQTAQDVAINQHILRRALEAGDVFLQKLFSMGGDPSPGYNRGERPMDSIAAERPHPQPDGLTMSLTSLLSIARTALLTQQKAIDVTGHNIANASTDGYTRQRLTLEAALPLQTAIGQIGRGVTATGLERIRSQFLDATYRKENGDLGSSPRRRICSARSRASLASRPAPGWPTASTSSSPPSATLRTTPRTRPPARSSARRAPVSPRCSRIPITGSPRPTPM